MKKYFKNKKYLFNCSSLFNINVLFEQLTIFYKATTVNKVLFFKNNYYIIISLIILSLITFFFNHRLDYFNNFTLDFIGENLFETNIKRITFFSITIYLCYIKFILLTRIFSLIRGFSFFYREIKMNLIKDIKIICIYFYIFNLFFISISILFILNLTNNIFIIDSYLEMLINNLTNFTSVLILSFYYNRIINSKFNINTNEINPLKILLLIVIIFTPLILLNFYEDKIHNLLYHWASEHNIFKFKFIHSDYIEDLNYKQQLKEENYKGAISPTPIKEPISNAFKEAFRVPFRMRFRNPLSDGAKINNLPMGNNTLPVKFIYDLKDLPPNILTEMLTRHIEIDCKDGVSVKRCVYSFTDNIVYKGVEYQLHVKLVNFLDDKINDLFLDSTQLYFKPAINNLNICYKTEMKYNDYKYTHESEILKKLSDLERLKTRNEYIFSEEPFLYKDFQDNEYLPDKTELEEKKQRLMNFLNEKYKKETEYNLKLFKHPSVLDKALNKLTKKISIPKFKK